MNQLLNPTNSHLLLLILLILDHYCYSHSHRNFYNPNHPHQDPHLHHYYWIVHRFHIVVDYCNLDLDLGTLEPDIPVHHPVDIHHNHIVGFVADMAAAADIAGASVAVAAAAAVGEEAEVAAVMMYYQGHLL